MATADVLSIRENTGTTGWSGTIRGRGDGRTPPGAADLLLAVTAAGAIRNIQRRDDNGTMFAMRERISIAVLFCNRDSLQRVFSRHEQTGSGRRLP
jgi:hypothetical protein